MSACWFSNYNRLSSFYWEDSNWGSLLAELNDDAFEFVALIHRAGVDLYDFTKRVFA